MSTIVTPRYGRAAVLACSLGGGAVQSASAEQAGWNFEITPYLLAGLLPGTFFFAFSLTPSLLPRPFLIQGALSGMSFAAGYGPGVAASFLWNPLQLPLARGRVRPLGARLAPPLFGNAQVVSSGTSR